MDALRITGAERFYRGNSMELVRLELPPLTLQETLSRLGFELGELNPEQLAVVLAAKALRTVLANLQIDYSDRLSPDSAAVQSPHSEPEPRPAEPETTAESRESGLIPNENFGPLEGPHQIAQCLPSELAYLKILPLEFTRRLVAGELLGSVRPAENNSASETPPELPEPDDSQENAHRTEVRPLVAHVLLDVSESMGKRDRRGIVARGSALAFLLMSHERDAELQLTPFATTPGETTTARGNFGLHSLAVRVLTWPNSGSTNIQGTLTRIASEALPSQRTDLLLITDGLSTLGTNPLGHAHLHTIRIVVAEGDLNARLQSELEVNIKILRQWSDTLMEMDLKSILQEIRPTLHDLLPFTARLADFSSRLADVISDRQFQSLIRELDNLESLCRQLEASRGLESQSLQARSAYEQLKQRIAECRAEIQRPDRDALISENASRLGTETVQRMRALDELAIPVAELSATTRGGSLGEPRLTLKRGTGGGAGRMDWGQLWHRLLARLRAPLVWFDRRRMR